jgi:hypothetical protein
MSTTAPSRKAAQPVALGVTPFAANRWAVASSIAGQAPYIVTAKADSDGHFVFSCTCKAYAYQTISDGYDTCKHGEAVMGHPSATAFIRWCLTCGSQPATAPYDQCAGCQGLYPDGQEAAEWEADPVHARQVNLTRSRLAIATPLDALFG